MSETVKIAKDLRYLFNGPNIGNSPRVIKEMRNNSGGSLAPGDIVIFDTTVTYPAVTTTTAADDVKVAGVVAEASLSNELCKVVVDGYVDKINVNGTTAISVGNTLSTYTAAKIGQKATAGKGGGFAIALAAYAVADSAGVIAGIVKLMGNDSTGTATLGTAGQMAADGLVATNSAGVSANVAPIDHAHAYTNDTPALVFGTTNAVGTVGKPLAADASIALFDATAPAAELVGSTGVVGTALVASHRDHVHAMPASLAPVNGSLGSANAAGSGPGVSYGDHVHKAILANAVDLVLGTTDAAATAAHLSWGATETNKAVKIGVDSTSRRVLICDYADEGTDTTLAVAVNPELAFIAASGGTTHWLKMHVSTIGAEVDVNTNDTFRFLTAGSLKADVATGAFRGADGVVGAPGLTYQQEASTGLYRIGAGNLGLSLQGTKFYDIGKAAFTFGGANSTSNTAYTVQNTSNAAAASHSWVDVQTGGTTSTGSPQYRLTIPGGTSYLIANNSQNGSQFQIGTGTVVGTTVQFTLDPRTTGQVNLASCNTTPLAVTLANGAAARLIGFQLGGVTATLAGTTEVTSVWDWCSVGQLTIAQSGGAVIVDNAGGVVSFAPTTGASVTLTNGAAFYARNSGAAVGTNTNQFGVYVEALTSATRNYALWNNGASADVVLQGSGALLTTATKGFTYLPTCAGAPSGVPSGVTGAVPLIFDTTNNKIMVYNAAWKGVAVA